MRTAAAVGLIAMLVTFAGQAQSADLGYGWGHDAVPPPGARKRVAVVADELSFANGCPRDPRCIPPRILPIEGLGEARERQYRMIAVPVDPRFADRY